MKKKLDSIKERFEVSSEDLGWFYETPKIIKLIKNAEKALEAVKGKDNV